MVSDVLHDIFLLKIMLLENHIVEGQRKDHGHKLQVVLVFLHVSEEPFEVVSSAGQESDLILQDILGFFNGDGFFGDDGLPI